MITYAFARERRILLVRFPVAVTRESLSLLDETVRRLTILEGPVNSIVDFSEAPQSLIDLAIVLERTGRPLVMPGQRRVYVTNDDQLFGVLRVYAARQVVEPLVMRTLTNAFLHFEVAAEDFLPIGVNPANAPDPSV